MVVLQLGVLATYAGDNVQALYHYLYCLAVPVPFTTARANAKLLFEKVHIFCAFPFQVILAACCFKVGLLPHA